jgi:hypothetical protein
VQTLYIEQGYSWNITKRQRQRYATNNSIATRSITGTSSINLNKPRPKYCRLRHLVRAIELICAHCDSRNSQSVHEEVVVGEIRFEVHLITLHLDVFEVLDNGLILAIKICQTHIFCVIHTGVPLVERELYILVFSWDCLCLHTERLERLQRDGADVWARTFDDETLDGGECQIAGRCRHEWLRGRSLLLHESEETFLRCFIAHDGCYGSDKPVILVLGEDLVDVLQSAQDDIREGACQRNGGLEIRNWD